MEKKQTAVEWLVNHWRKLQKEGEKMSWNQIIEITELSKQMEREQIEEAYKEGAKKRFNTMLIKRDEINKSASDYFTQKYGKG